MTWGASRRFDDGGCTMVYEDNPSGPLLAQTWDARIGHGVCFDAHPRRSVADWSRAEHG